MPENKIEDPFIKSLKDKRKKGKGEWFGLEDNALNKSVMITAATVVAFSLMLTGVGFLLVAAAAGAIAYGALKANDASRENQSDVEALIKAYEKVQRENLKLKNGQTNKLGNSNALENLDRQIAQLQTDRNALRTALGSQTSDTSSTESMTSSSNLSAMTESLNSSQSTSTSSASTANTSRLTRVPRRQKRGGRTP